MKIGIFGSYNQTSIGDHAILEGILAQFRGLIAQPSFSVFSMNVESTERMLLSPESVRVVQGRPLRGKSMPAVPQGRDARESRISARLHKADVGRLHDSVFAIAKRLYIPCLVIWRDISTVARVSFWKRIRKEIRGLDILLIGGGNLVMDLYKAWPIYPLIYVALARSVGVPAMFYAVGAGPLKTWRGRLYLKLACHLATTITCRDQESLELMCGTLGMKRDKLLLSADPALCLASEMRGHNRRAHCGLIIGMSMVPFYRPGYWPNPNCEIYDQYVRSMVRVVEQLLENATVQVVLFATNHPHDALVAREVAAGIAHRERLEVIERKLGVDELLALIGKCDLVVGTRLHSLILSLVAGTPAFALSYQPKVASFYHRMGIDSRVIPLLPDISTVEGRVKELFGMFQLNREAVESHMNGELCRMREEALASAQVAVRIAGGRG